MSVRFLLVVGTAAWLPHAPLLAQESQGDEDQSELASAEPGKVRELLAKHRDAEDEGDAARLRLVLDAMAAFDNAEFLEPALAALKYKASKFDRKAVEQEADELGIRSKKEIVGMLAAREAGVQAAGARLASNHPDERKVTPSLLKLFKQKGVRTDRPEAYAAAIMALGRIGHGKIEKDVFGEYRLYGDEQVMRACVRYFGLLPTKNMKVVRALCEDLAAPEPGDVNSPTNPPASYWTARWETWSKIRRDVSWALKQITGQVFEPADGEHPGDCRKALEYVKEHKRELGLK